MIDDDDIEWALLFSSPTGCIGTLMLILFLIVLSFIVSQNKAECAEKHCERGTSQLIDHRCLCVTEPP